jgi:gamma-glutamyl:cysteine ligase YbdK (ATP-grasp superfamily)
MTTHIDTIVGNKGLSEKLTGMLVDLRDTIGSAFETIEDKIEKINAQAHSEGFEDYEIELLLRMYLSGAKTKRQLKWILTDKPRIKEQKKLMENGDIGYLRTEMVIGCSNSNSN